MLQRLAALIRSRRRMTAREIRHQELLDGGPERCARKLGEEATETVIAALGSDGHRAQARSCRSGLPPSRLAREPAARLGAMCCEELESRMGTSGLAEKAAGKTPEKHHERDARCLVVFPDDGRPSEPGLFPLSRVLTRAMGEAACRHADDVGAARPRTALGSHRGSVDGGGRANLFAAVAPPQSACRRCAGAARCYQPLSRPQGTACALHPGHCRFGGRRQEHHGPRAA